MNRADRYTANVRYLEARAAGLSWQQAAALAGLPCKRAAAYGLEHRVRQAGPAALTDGRQGHPAKLRAEVRTWLETTVRAHPDYAGPQLQQALQTQFGLTVSVSQINRVRAALGLPYTPPKKSP